MNRFEKAVAFGAMMGKAASTRIRLSLIPPDNQPQLRPHIDALRNAVNSGSMDDINAATNKLLSLTGTEGSVDLSERRWNKHLAKIRKNNPEFQSDYLVPGETYPQLFPNIDSKMKILQLPFNQGILR